MWNLILGGSDFVWFLFLFLLLAKATTGGAAWPLVESDIEWAKGQNALKGKKILLDEVRAWGI